MLNDSAPCTEDQVKVRVFLATLAWISLGFFVGALLQKRPRPLLFIPSRKSGGLPPFRGYFLPGQGERYYHRELPEDDLPLPEMAEELVEPPWIQPVPSQPLELPAAKWLLLGFLMAIALGVAVLAEKGEYKNLGARRWKAFRETISESRAAAAQLKKDGTGGGTGAVLNSAVGSVDMPDLQILQSDGEAGEWRSIPKDGSGMGAKGVKQMAADDPDEKVRKGQVQVSGGVCM